MNNMFFVIITALFLAGCKSGPTSPVNSDFYGMWKAHNIHDYKIEQTMYCFCVYGAQKMEVNVRFDTVYSVMNLSDSTMLEESMLKSFYSIDSLFALIKKHTADSLRITYNNYYGFPDTLDINPQMHPVDGGILYVTSNLRPLLRGFKK